MKASWKAVVAGTALLVLVAPALVGAQDRERRNGRGNFDPSQFFDRMDANGDGALDSSEFRGPEDRFKEADTDGDGKVSKAEMEAGFQARAAEFRRGGDGSGGPGGPGAFGGSQIDRIKELLGVSAEEWAILKPRIEKVTGIQSELRGSTRGGNTSQLPEAQALRTTLDNADAPAEDIAKGIKALREAREKKQAELKTAREELRELLTPHQEGLLLLDGILD